jgi:hypothetical protein
MKKRSLCVVLFACGVIVLAAASPRDHTVTTPSGRTAHPEKQYSIATLEDGSANQEKEKKRQKDAETKGDVYLAKFEVPAFPTPKELSEIKAVLKSGDQIWSFHGLDSGWIILRGDKEVYQLVTDHDY